MNNPPLIRDFESFKKMKPNRDYSPNTCRACGLSVFKSQEAIITAKKLVPALKRYPFTTVGQISENSGVLLETPGPSGPDHMTWWIKRGKKDVYLEFKAVD